MNSRRIPMLLFVVLALVAGGACSSDNKVGEGLDTDLEGGGNTRLGETTTTVAPVTTAPVATTAKPVATTPPRAAAVTTAPPAAPAIVVKIQSASPQFDPALAAVRSGATVRWQNTDSQPRSVEADNGSFKSPLIPPGGTFDLKAPGPGTYNYHDGTRPFAVAQLQVG